MKINYDELSAQLWELSKLCPKEHENQLMEMSVLINKLKELLS